jgi:hypothetical protein
MTESPDRLYDLLPAIYRLRDSEQGYPLRALLQIIAEQVEVVEQDIAQLYENWFIETCQDWALPYIGELIGYAPVDGAAGFIPRREVANTIRYRQRKGALALLELLCADVAGWPARAVEFYTLLGLTRPASPLAPVRGQLADLRKGDALDRLDGPFDELAHTVDLRRPGDPSDTLPRPVGRQHEGPRTRGRYNIPNVGLFVWRLRSYSLTRAPANSVDQLPNHYTFSLLGNDAPLFVLPVAEASPTHIADERNLPTPLRRRALAELTADFYGPGKSLCIWPDDPSGPHVLIDQIVAADLSNWAYRPPGNLVAVDPVLGRIVFGPRAAPKQEVYVSYHYGFSSEMGGGEYARELRPLGKRARYAVRQRKADAGEEPAFPSVGAALERWQAERADPTLERWQHEQPDDVLIEILDSGSYDEQLDIELLPGQRLELRAAQATRPLITPLLYRKRRDALRVKGSATLDEGQRAPRLLLDGLLVSGRSIEVSGRVEHIHIRHCTLVPGWSLKPDCTPQNMEEPSLVLLNTGAQVLIEHSIVGSIQVEEPAVSRDPLPILISDSILDATADELDALGTPDGRSAHATLTVLRCTVIGVFRAHAILLAENSIFDGLVRVARRQIGCMRFCYLPPGSRTPRRTNCQPDTALAAAIARGFAPDGPEVQRERERVQPQFTSRRYGSPAYCQLGAGCPAEISSGADDQSEMGAFHHLRQPQRTASLRTRLDEYLPAGMDAGIFFAT